MDQLRALQHRCPLLAIALRHLGQQLLQTPPGDGVVEREVRAAEERGAVGRQENGDGVPSQPGQELHRRCVPLRHVGTLVAVDAHRNEQRVDHGAEQRVAVHLAVHDAAPAAIVGSYIKEDRPVESCGQRKRVTTPLLPAHRLLRRPGQVRSGRLCHPVGQGSVLGNARQGEERQGKREAERPDGSHECAWKIPSPSRTRSRTDEGLGAPSAKSGVRSLLLPRATPPRPRAVCAIS